MRFASRVRHSQLASAAGLLGAALLLAPPPAAAGRGDWDDDDRHERRHYQRRHYQRDHEHHDHGGGWCPPRYARPLADHHGSYWRAPRVQRARYHCEPCGNWYGDEASFHYHVHHHHHVPIGLLPLVVMATVFGAVFGGY